MPSSCTKRSFFSEETAWLVIGKCTRKGYRFASRWKKVNRVYKCKHCGFWHLTSQENKREKGKGK